jgi:NitT/TauT family transport system permease protein
LTARAVSRGRGGRLVDRGTLAQWLPPLVVFVGVLVLWEGLFRLLEVKSFLIPRPTQIADALVLEWPSLSRGVVYTGFEAVAGLAMGVGLGTAFGLATARWSTAREVLVPLGTGASTVPIIAFAPIALNWFGLDNPLSRIAIVALIVFFPVMVNTIRGLTEVEPGTLELMDSYAASDLQVLRRVRIPNALPYWFTALRIGVTLSVIGAVVGEFFGGPLYALGIFVTNMTGAFRYPAAWAAIVVACVLGIVLYLAAIALERLVMPWQRRGDEPA